MESCPVCNSSAKIIEANPRLENITCTRCGKFALPKNVKYSFPTYDPNWSKKLQEYIQMLELTGRDFRYAAEQRPSIR